MDLKTMRYILPFVQAMEDVRFTAVDMQNYMVAKSIADSKAPYYWDNIRKKYNMDDV